LLPAIYSRTNSATVSVVKIHREDSYKIYGTANTLPSGSVLEFGPFGFDPASRKLRNKGTAIRLNGMPLKVLVHLLERPGELVSRTELQRLLWSNAAYGSFEQGLNSLVNVLRGVLSDRADRSTYIETLPGEGYRFIAPVRFVTAEASSLESPPESPPLSTSIGREIEAIPEQRASPVHHRAVRFRWWLGAGLLVTMFAGLT
jgi:DNA-binding winged helix-turn-helix (wHTH) protein